VNSISVFGWTLYPIHIQLIQLGFVVLASGGLLGILYRSLKAMWAERKNLQLDHYLDTCHVITEPDADGFRTLKIRDHGNVERLETVFRGTKERQWLLAAARACDWTHRFAKDTDATRQARIYHNARHAVNRHFVAGVNARQAGLPVVAYDLYFSLTGADAAVGGVRMIRNIEATREQLEIVYSHPRDKWKFEGDMGKPQPDHQVRIETLWQMADALFNHNGCRQLNGGWVKIVGWTEAVVPVNAS